MSETFASFNALPRDEAELRLLSCCGSRAWASAVAAARPYPDMKALMTTADAVWADLDPTDWLEAFAAHPRLGEGGGSSPVFSSREQSRIIGAPGETLAELAEQNRLYEAKFGRVFLISAAGHSAEEVLAALLGRIENDPTTEAKVAAEEQRKITRRRLESMLQG